MWGFFAAIGAIVGAVVGAVAVVATAVSSVVVAPAVVVGAAVGVMMCVANAFNICPPPSSPTPSGNNSSVQIINPPATNTTTNTTNNNSNTGSNSGGAVNNPCQTSATNSCGMHGTGFIVNGVCNATIPPISSCPLPVINSGSGFYAEPALVRAGQQTTLRWNVLGATACSITGGALNLTGLATASNVLTGGVNQKTSYTLTCINGVGGPSASAQATVNISPSFQEN